MADHPSAGLTSLSMLDRARAGDPLAWQRFVQLYSPLIYTWARRAGLSDHDAAEATQEVWRSVSANLARFVRPDEGGGLRAWLWAITRNKVRDHFRDAGPRAVGGSEALASLHEVPESEPDDDSRHADTAALLRRAMDLVRGDFEDRTWEAFRLTAVEGRTAAEAAAETTLSVDAVYQAKARVMRRLREEMRGMIDVPETA